MCSGIPSSFPDVGFFFFSPTWLMQTGKSSGAVWRLGIVQQGAPSISSLEIIELPWAVSCQRLMKTPPRFLEQFFVLLPNTAWQHKFQHLSPHIGGMTVSFLDFPPFPVVGYIPLGCYIPLVVTYH